MSWCALIVLSPHLSQLNWNQPCLKPAFRLCTGDLGCMMLQLFSFRKWGFRCKCAQGYFNIPPAFSTAVHCSVMDTVLITISPPPGHATCTVPCTRAGPASWQRMTSWQDKVSPVLKRDPARLWKMHQLGWLLEIVLASCWHTNQHRCRLSALILVNTNNYVRKGSDRCMIELLKSRHSQRLSSSLIISLSCCDFPHAFPHRHYMHQLSFICRHVRSSFPTPYLG